MGRPRLAAALPASVLALGCAAEQPRCATYGFDLVNETDEVIRMGWVTDDPDYRPVELVPHEPIEVHHTTACDTPDPTPADLPSLSAFQGGETFAVALEPSDWSSRAYDTVRGYHYYRASVQERHLVPLD